VANPTADLVNRLRQTAAAGYAGWDTARDAADEIERLRECLKLIQWRTQGLIDDQKHATVGTERWRIRQDARITLRAIDEVIGAKPDDVSVTITNEGKS
jgi:hypothetical protein